GMKAAMTIGAPHESTEADTTDFGGDSRPQTAWLETRLREEMRHSAEKDIQIQNMQELLAKLETRIGSLEGSLQSQKPGANTAWED
ncbi:unnamed protein product, partial [Polarella glacialis]